ncbi:MAG: hypothetical protein JWL77_6893 [Chthonomonadaceae bacterium]|nr:hypothetical protein [Chthonomonadaceae bacterium]
MLKDFCQVVYIYLHVLYQTFCEIIYTQSSIIDTSLERNRSATRRKIEFEILTISTLTDCSATTHQHQATKFYVVMFLSIISYLGDSVYNDSLYTIGSRKTASIEAFIRAF